MNNKNKILFIQINQQTNEIIIKLNNTIYIQKKLLILFNKNEIEINQDNAINILETKEREIEFQQTKYKLTQEELLSIYLTLIIDEIEREWIITNIEIENENKILIKTFQLLGFKEKFVTQK